MYQSNRASSLLLNYAYIEFEEGRGNLEECKTAYNNLVDRLTSDTDINIASTKQDIEDALEEKRRVEAQEQATRAQQNHFDETEVVSEEARKQEAESIRKAIEDSRSGKLEELRRLGTNVWIMYMRFARRAEVGGTYRMKRRRLTALSRVFKQRAQSFLALDDGHTSLGTPLSRPVCFD